MPLSRTIYKSDTTLRSHLVRPKDTVDPAKQDSVLYRIPCERENDRDIRLARTQTSTVSEHAHDTGYYPIWNEVKFIDRDPHWYTRRVREAIHDFILIKSTGIAELKFLKRGCPRSKNTTTGERYNSRPLR